MYRNFIGRLGHLLVIEFGLDLGALSNPIWSYTALCKTMDPSHLRWDTDLSASWISTSHNVIRTPLISSWCETMEISHLSERQCCNSRMLRISTHFPSKVEAIVIFIYDCIKKISPQPLGKPPTKKTVKYWVCQYGLNCPLKRRVPRLLNGNHPTAPFWPGLCLGWSTNDDFILRGSEWSSCMMISTWFQL